MKPNYEKKFWKKKNKFLVRKKNNMKNKKRKRKKSNINQLPNLLILIYRRKKLW